MFTVTSRLNITNSSSWPETVFAFCGSLRSYCHKSQKLLRST